MSELYGYRLQKSTQRVVSVAAISDQCSCRQSDSDETPPTMTVALTFVMSGAGESLASRLLAMRERRGWSMAQLAERSGLSPATIWKIEHGRTPNPGHATLRKIADAFGEHVDILTGGSTPPPQPVVFGGVAGVPLVRYTAHAGSETVWTEVDAPREWVPESAARGRRLLAAEVVGRCLSPEIESGDVVVFDTHQRDPSDGDIVVITTPSAGVFVKRAYRFDGTIRLLPDDGDVPPGEAVTIEGTVLRIVKTPRRSMRL